MGRSFGLRVAQMIKKCVHGGCLRTCLTATVPPTGLSQVKETFGHAVDTVGADQFGVGLWCGAQHRIESLNIAGRVAAERGTLPPGDHASVVDGSVRLTVEENITATSDGRDDRHMNVGGRLTIVAVVLRSKLEESEEFKEHAATIQLKHAKREFSLAEVFGHPENAILGILIGVPQSIAGYLVLTFGVAYMVSKGTAAQVGFIGAMLVGVLQIFAAPLWGSLFDKIGRRKTYIGGCVAFALLLYPTLTLYSTDVAVLIWLGMIIGFVIPGVAMQATLQTMLCEMFDVEARTTGANIGIRFRIRSAAASRC
jgi:hypothetical protein